MGSLTADRYLQKYRLINYFDVWYSKEEGWEVNNQCIEFEDLMISNDVTEKELAEYLVKIGFLTTSDLRKVYVDSTSFDNGWEIYQRKGMMPLGRIELVEGERSKNGKRCIIKMAA